MPAAKTKVSKKTSRKTKAPKSVSKTKSVSKSVSKSASKTKTSKGKGKKSTKVSKKVETPVVETPVVETPVVETPAVETPAVVKSSIEEAVVKAVVKAVAKELIEDEDVKIDLEFNSTISSMKTLVADTRGVLSSFKTLHKRVNKRLKALNKKPKGGKRRGGNQKSNPSGFNKPTKITNDLAKFLDVEEGTCLPRTDVTRRINAYIKEHSLQGMEVEGKSGLKKMDNRYINTTLPKSDKRSKWATQLRKLLKPKENLSYFNLQTYLSPHFIKEPKKV